MRNDTLEITVNGKSFAIPLVSVNTVIVGAGAAGLKCADTLYQQGVRDIAIVVDKLGNGTSNNSGSDKQTYYKLGVFGDEPDSPMDFARTLYQGGMMHGDLAYIEGLGSAPAFFDLCRLGVPFPFNQYGGYVGYKTDHDPRQRGTSAGPKTSMFMFQKLLKEVRSRQTPIFDRHEAVRLLTEPGDVGENRVVGVLCIDKTRFYDDNFGLTAFSATNVVLATGGPGELYKISVWPHGQIGSHGLALEAGAVANNVTELQYGLASIKFRWNLSGTYQQVVPDYFSTAADGVSDKRHFLHDYFDDMPHMATNIFLKGYQWPFHAARLQHGGSSIIDIAVHNEIAAGRRVFMDFMKNPTPAPGMSEFKIAEMHDDARVYLEKSGALQDTPYERLVHMNKPSIDLYAEHGIDLRDPLEVAVCAQHCNGGLRGDIWWQTSVPHLFAIGELNGSHGVRPGGSALNSGQVGAVRAAQYIAGRHHHAPLERDAFNQASGAQIADFANQCERWLAPDSAAVSLSEIRPAIQERMSRAGAFVRELGTVKAALAEARELYRRIVENGIACPGSKELARAVEDRHLALTSIAFLQAIEHYIENGGGSRGGYMILDDNGDRGVESKRGSELRHRSENQDKRKEILEISLTDPEIADFAIAPVPVRPLPQDDSWYETAWADWNEGRIFG